MKFCRHFVGMSTKKQKMSTKGTRANNVICSLLKFTTMSKHDTNILAAR